MKHLETLLQDETAGDPISGVKWTRKTLAQLADALKTRYACPVGRETVRRLLAELDYTLRSNRKRLSKCQDADRARPMRYLVRQRRAFVRAKQPVISVDTKKKELIGNFRNAGRTWRREAWEVLATDFPSDAEGKALPYGVYDVARHRGFVGSGVSHETAQFAGQVIRQWWRHEGARAYPDATARLIEAAGGGANGYRRWPWKWEGQPLADETGLTIRVTHYPTSASKWNPVEHRWFCHISRNWAGQPLRTYETVLKFIRTTRTKTGLRCRAYLDTADYPTRVKISAEQKSQIRLTRHRVLPKWNYTIKPRIE